jgi:hypothetical protein
MNTFNPKEYKVVALREAHGPFVCPDCCNEVRGATLNLATDFAPRERDWWEGNGLTVPAAKIFMHRNQI